MTWYDVTNVSEKRPASVFRISCTHRQKLPPKYCLLAIPPTWMTNPTQRRVPTAAI
jgi:hypothetical protein